MNKGLPVALSVVLTACFLFFSCASAPEPVDEEPPMETAPVEETEPEAPPKGEPIEDKPEPVAEVEPEESSEETKSEEEVFSVSEEVFTETFEDIRKLISDLNAIIREENYDRWLRYLTAAYKEHFSSPEVLKEHSDQPLLKKYNINLTSMNDYFKWVVVPSRSNARLDDLVFIDNETVKAIMIIKDRRTILYLLEKDGDGWKIGL